MPLLYSLFFFFTDTATTEIYTLSLHDALPICPSDSGGSDMPSQAVSRMPKTFNQLVLLMWSVWSLTFVDRKSTRLNSSHVEISYAVFCLKKKKKKIK